MPCLPFRLRLGLPDTVGVTMEAKRGMGGLWGFAVSEFSNTCRNLIKKPWAYIPQNSRIHIRNPSKDPWFLNQVPT